MSRTRNSEVGGWRHDMKTFSAILVICKGTYRSSTESPYKRPAAQTLDLYVFVFVFAVVVISELLNKQNSSVMALMWRHCHHSHPAAEWDYLNVGVVVKYDGLLADGAIPLDMQWSCSMWPSLLLEQYSGPLHLTLILFRRYKRKEKAHVPTWFRQMGYTISNAITGLRGEYTFAPLTIPWPTPMQIMCCQDNK